MSVQDDKAADQDNDRRPTEKPEPDEDDRPKAAEMMTAYADDRPTVVLPGSGGSVTGTAVNDWLDDDGNPKYQGARPKRTRAKSPEPTDSQRMLPTPAISGRSSGVTQPGRKSLTAGTALRARIPVARHPAVAGSRPEPSVNRNAVS